MDKNLLKSFIVRSGLTHKEVATKLGLSEAGFSQKMQGHTEFTLREIRSIIFVLRLNEDEVLDVFFG